MQKFSLYDLLSVLFPGVILLYMLDEVRRLFYMFPLWDLTKQWDVILILSVIFGAVIYVVSFWLTKHWEWLYKSLGIYKHVTQIYNQSTLHKHLGEGLNRRANEWYGSDIFLPVEAFNELPKAEQKSISDKQDEFYDRMYYELDYLGKFDVPKAFQSFYLFFRNLFLASLLSALALVVAYLISFISNSNFAHVDVATFVYLLALFVVTAALSVVIACWYRQRMVHKMYWFFYTHIINAQK
jgi:hypothetical protein